MNTLNFTPRYAESRALVIGINDYKHVSKLHYATNDAKAVAEVLQSKFGFSEDRIMLLLDEDATKVAILEAFLSYSSSGVDDRVIVFFAGHGHTVTSSRGEVGYLVPVDASPENLASLIRWDDLTRNADLIPAKHIFFVMDACYGGLAFLRQPQFGSVRFLKDMLQRVARQVLSSGKANEPVSDGNGRRPNHSIFTSYLLDALDGKAATAEGTITASSVMAYVYEHVGKDQYSRQTPHHGHIARSGRIVDTTYFLPDWAD